MPGCHRNRGAAPVTARTWRAFAGLHPDTRR